MHTRVTHAHVFGPNFQEKKTLVSQYIDTELVPPMYHTLLYFPLKHSGRNCSLFKIHHRLEPPPLCEVSPWPRAKGLIPRLGAPLCVSGTFPPPCLSLLCSSLALLLLLVFTKYFPLFGSVAVGVEAAGLTVSGGVPGPVLGLTGELLCCPSQQEADLGWVQVPFFFQGPSGCHHHLGPCEEPPQAWWLETINIRDLGLGQAWQVVAQARP